MYGTGESVDSNPVVASLNPSKPTSEGSPSNHSPDHSPDHSSDEETGGPTSKGHPNHTLGTTATTQPPTQPQQNSSSPEPPPPTLGTTATTQPPTQPQQNSSSPEPPPPTNESRDIDKPATESVGLQETELSHTFNTLTHDIPSALSDETPPWSDPTLPPESPPFHFQKTKHIAIDTVSVMSGNTIEYSALPSVVSTSADTLLSQSSLELDTSDTGSSDSESTTASIDFSVTDKTSGQMEDSSNVVPEHTEGVANLPATSPFPTTASLTSARIPPTLLSGTTHASTSTNLVDSTLSSVSHGLVQGQLSISSEHESSLISTLPRQTVNNMSLVLTNALGPNKAGTFKASSSDFSTDIPQTNTIAQNNENMHLVATEPLCMTPLSQSEIPSTMVSEQPGSSITRDFSKAVAGKAGGMVSSYIVSATETEPTKPVSASITREIDTDALSLKTNNFLAIPGSPPGEEHVLNTISTASAQPHEIAANNNLSTSGDVASRLLMELEKSLSQSD